MPSPSNTASSNRCPATSSTVALPSAKISVTSVVCHWPTEPIKWPQRRGSAGDRRLDRRPAFLSGVGQVWQRKYREDALIQRLTTDPHSPSEFRVNGVVRNLLSGTRLSTYSPMKRFTCRQSNASGSGRSIKKGSLWLPFFALKNQNCSGACQHDENETSFTDLSGSLNSNAALYAAAQESFDLLIKNGRIVDGTGTPWYEADVGIVDDRIARVGNPLRQVPSASSMQRTWSWHQASSILTPMPYAAYSRCPTRKARYSRASPRLRKAMTDLRLPYR